MADMPVYNNKCAEESHAFAIRRAGSPTARIMASGSAFFASRLKARHGNAHRGSRTAETGAGFAR
jgi:hypothetical protein